MLAIRLQRTGRKGHAQYRVIVQDSRFSPKSGRVVSSLGSYNPHTKSAIIDNELASKYLANGAQPSDRSASILKEAGVKLPKWYSASPVSKKTTKNPEKLRKNQPAGTKPKASSEPISGAVEEPKEDTVEADNTVGETAGVEVKAVEQTEAEAQTVEKPTKTTTDAIETK